MPRPSFFRQFGLYFVEDFFDRELQERLRSEMQAAPSREGRVVVDGTDVLKPESRQVADCLLSRSTVKLIYKKSLAIMPELARHFECELEDCDPPGFFSYGEGSFYGPHLDRSPDALEPIRRRRVSIVVFLNDWSRELGGVSYQGGDLTFHRLMTAPGFQDCAFSLEPKAGLLVAFRSEWLHEVKPVISGQRMTVVTWFNRPVLAEDAPVSEPAAALVGE